MTDVYMLLLLCYTHISQQTWTKRRIKLRRHDARAAVRQAWHDYEALNVAMNMAQWNVDKVRVTLLLQVLALSNIILYKYSACSRCSTAAACCRCADAMLVPVNR